MLLFAIITALLLSSSYADEETDELFFDSLKHLAENDTEPRISIIDIFKPDLDVSFQLYTRESEDYTILKLYDVDSVKNSNFQLSRDTKLLIHGWLSKTTEGFCEELKNVYLQTNDVNVILVEWPARNLYEIARILVEPVGDIVTKFLDFLVSDVGVDKSTIHVLGHSLGAHIAGIGGNNMVNRPLPRITGFDPAGPLFTSEDKNGRIDKSDADFVDIIHTCAGVLGFMDPIGHADFYPNGGTPVQPGCVFEFGACSHSRSYEYYMEALNQTILFLAVPCNNYSDFQNARCCTGIVKMGPEVDKSIRGKFYLMTGDKSPYALGNESIVDPC